MMFSFVPNISDALTSELRAAEKLECQEKLWRSQNRTVSFTQSLCLTAPYVGKAKSEFLHSIHVVPNDFNQCRPDKTRSNTYSPGVAVARRCYICDDPFCPNISLVNKIESFSQSVANRQDRGAEREQHLESKFAGCVTENVNGVFERGEEDVLGEKASDIMSPRETLPSETSCVTEADSTARFKEPTKLMFSKEISHRIRPTRSFTKGDKSPFTAIKQLFVPPGKSANSSRQKRKFSPRITDNGFEFSQCQTESSGYVSGHFERGDNSTNLSSSCCCKGPYHCHTFNQNTSAGKTSSEVVKNMAKFSSVRRLDNQVSFDRSSQSSQSNLLHYSEKDNHRNICMTFWKPELSFCQYKYGDKLVEFESLWPSEERLQKTMAEVCHDTVLRRAVLDMCKIALRCGPVRLLKALLTLKLVSLDQVFEDGSGMLHLALIARNSDALHFLCQTGISPKIRDKFGHTADQVCFSGQLRKLIPQRYLISNSSQSSRLGKALIFPTVHDVESIFNLAKSSKHFDELQKKLQTYDFDINGQCDTKGDYLVHIAAKGGLSHLPLLLTLVRVQGADIELCNNSGMTPLMISAQNGDAVLCDVLLCVFGCNPNKPNPSTGSYALHFACASKSSEVVNCLLNRGADFNLEDLTGRRPDDLSFCPDTEECRAIVRSRRMQRSEYLSKLIEKGDKLESEVRYTDLCVVGETGRTLIMVAAETNRVEQLELLLAVEGSPIDAQHEKTGQTALSMAAQTGNMETVRVLLSRDANPGIPDLHGYLPLHYAVMNGHGDVLETMLEFFPKTFMGLHMASRLAVNTAIHNRIKAAILKRKERILTPELYDCALTGDGERLFQVLEDGDSVNLKRDVAPLYLAVENGHLDVIKLLYEKGGDITKRHPVTQATVLHAAAKMGHSEVVQFLLKFCRPVTPPLYTLLALEKSKRFTFSPYRSLNHSHYKELDINALDGDGKTPLQLAADKGYRTIVKLLLDQGATTALLGEQGELIMCPEYEGVRIMIESYREQHTALVMKCILDRKGLNNLKQVWLPRFDHNLRDRFGNTPLMVACKTGRSEVVKFLLESAVYTTTPPDDYVSDDSDTDSGLDRTSTITPSVNKRGEMGEDISCPDSQSSRYAVSVMYPQGRVTSLRPGISRPPSAPLLGQRVLARRSPSWVNLDELTSQFGMTRNDNDHDFLKSLPATLMQSYSDSQASNSKYVISKLMTDLQRPKGLQIYHDNKVCHICAVNLLDGSTALHRAIEGGDNPQLTQLLLAHDPTVAHAQNLQGYSPLHTACKLNRKKVVQLLLSVHDIDVHCLTADGQQAEELCSSKAVRKLLVKARTDHPQLVTAESLVTSQTSSSHNGDTMTTINLDKIVDKYNALKRGLRGDGGMMS